MDPIIQWYPGHIARLDRQLEKYLKQLDVVVEIVDARIPLTSWHKVLSTKLRQKKPVLLVLNKSDLADPKWTEKWIQYFCNYYTAVVAFNSKSSKGKAVIVDNIVSLGEPLMQKHESRGLKRRPFRVGVAGMPNVGKSSLINALVGQKKVTTGHRAGVTRQTQWVRINPMIELLDTPGLIPPRLDSPETGQLLASVYSVGDASFDEETVASFFMDKVENCYPGLLAKVFDLPVNKDLSLEEIAVRRGYVLPEDKLDLKRAAKAVLKDYRSGKLGGITLERPPK